MSRSVAIATGAGVLWVSDNRRPGNGLIFRQGDGKIRLTAAETLAMFDAAATLLRSPEPLAK